MENITQDTINNIIRQFYNHGMSYEATMSVIKRTFLLSKEDCLHCDEIWNNYANNKDIK